MSLPKRVLITGIHGNIGRALALNLMQKGCEVSGVDRFEADTFYQPYIAGEIPYTPQVFISEMMDKGSILNILKQTNPQYAVHLAACVHVGESFTEPLGTFHNNIFSTFTLLDAVKEFDSSIGLLNAASAEVFGDQPSPQNESTPFSPQSPYAVSKVANVYSTRMYRAYGLRFSNAYFYNNESIHRSTRYVSRKIIMAVPRIRLGLQQDLRLGNLNARRSWMAREDMVTGIEAIMGLPYGDDFIIAPDSSYSRSVRELAEMVFELDGMPIKWQIEQLSSSADTRNEVLREIGVAQDGRVVVRVDEGLLRPLDVPDLIGDATKLHDATGWTPQVSFKTLVINILNHDRQLALTEARARGIIAP